MRVAASVRSHSSADDLTHASNAIWFPELELSRALAGHERWWDDGLMILLAERGLVGPCDWKCVYRWSGFFGLVWPARSGLRDTNNETDTSWWMRSWTHNVCVLYYWKSAGRRQKENIAVDWLGFVLCVASWYGECGVVGNRLIAMSHTLLCFIQCIRRYSNN